MIDPPAASLVRYPQPTSSNEKERHITPALSVELHSGSVVSSPDLL